jgi:uncharacterized protein (DUF58 family)
MINTILSKDIMSQIRRIELRTRRLVTDSFAGEYHSVFKGRGMAFEEVRPYQPGDEIRMIDWNVTARFGEPFVKQFVEERELTVMLLVDASASGNFGSVQKFKRELAAELTAVLAFTATTNNDKVGLMIFTDEVELYVPPRKGRKHILRLIRELLTFEPQRPGTDIKNALDTLNRVLKRRSIAFLISDFVADPESYRRTLAITNRRHDLIAIELSDPLDGELPAVGLLALEDAETGDFHWVDTADKKWRRNYEQQHATLANAKKKAFSRARVDRLTVATPDDYMTALTRFFDRRAKRLAAGR